MGTFIRLVDYSSQQEKEIEFFNKKNRHYSDTKRFSALPSLRFIYWMSNGMMSGFEVGKPLYSYGTPRQGLITGSVGTFVRLWFECNSGNCGFIEREGKKWFPYNSGGGFRKWYGNQENVVNWENDGYEIKNFKDPDTGKLKSRPQGQDYYFKKCISWSKISTSRCAFRFYDSSFIFSDAGMAVFADDNNEYLLGLLNSKVSDKVLRMLSPTTNVESGDVKDIPVILDDEETIVQLVNSCISESKEEWDEYEQSWAFQKHSLVKMVGESMGLLIADKFGEYDLKCQRRFERVKENEIKINDHFINIYGLQDEMSSDIEDEDITIRKADLEREIKSLISYAVGCIMGRYSLKEDGLIYAGGVWEPDRYSEKFKPCNYGVMLITEEQYFEEDLCTRVIDFIETVYGRDTLNENLNFIAKALKPGAKESARQVIRNYLYDEKGFFDNHYQIYQHRPIYWMMSSGKNGGFRALVYMHRYDQNTLSIVRSDFLHELRYKYEADQTLQHKKEIEATTTADRNDAKKKSAALDKKLVEVNQYDDLLNHATGNITAYTFDLDDGVKTNYSKFLNIDGIKTQNLLVPIKL